MSSQIRLSICIPTYNFGSFIGETLESIVPNLQEGVELVVLDGGSTDNTEEEVKKRTGSSRKIRYVRQPARGGIDRDIARVVDLASGEYCWLFSADDVMKPGAVSRVLDEVQSGCDLYLCEHTLCDFKMHPVMSWPIFRGITSAETFDLSNAKQRSRYFSKARTSEAFFSFLSGPIFRRARWKEAEPIPEQFVGTGWALGGRLLSLASKKLQVCYLGHSLLYKRGENDSFRDQGIVRRMKMSVDGFGLIADTLFGHNSFEARHIRRVMRSEWTLRVVLVCKLAAADDPQHEDIMVLQQVVARHYLNAGFFNACKYMAFVIMPVWLIRFLRLLPRVLRVEGAT